MKNQSLYHSLLWFATWFLLITCAEPEVPKPEVSKLTPDKGAVGDTVIITGKNFNSLKTVNFGSIPALTQLHSDTEILAVVPPKSIPGKTTVTVTNEGGGSEPKEFTVLYSVPEIKKIDPAQGPIGKEITITGEHFSTATIVTFGSIPVTTFTKTDEEIKVNVPAGLELGALDVTVKAEGGTSDGEPFTVVGKPIITEVTPLIGGAGKEVSIGGTFLDGATEVYFGAGKATVFTVINVSLIQATVPASATTGKVKVITPGGEAISAADFIIKGAPQITEFTPASGIVGTVVTVKGTNFDAGSLTITFGNGKATEVTLVNATQLTAKVPAAGTTGQIKVETSAGAGLSTGNFTVIGSPAVTSFSPQSGGIGIDVDITGSNFVGVTAVKFNNTTVTAGNYTVMSQTLIKAKVPTGASSGKISVSTGAGSGISTTNFTVAVPPAISSFTPLTGLQGIMVEITGSNFSDITSVSFNDVEAGAGNYTVNSATKITAKVPPTATSGKIKVRNAIATATSTATFYVTPVISNVNPSTISAGSTITITGTNLDASKVNFGSSFPNQSPATNTSTSITVVVPQTLLGSVNLTVTNLGGTSAAKTFTATAPVVVDKIAASSNVKGQLLLVVGSNLLGATKVFFGSAEAAVLTSTSKVVSTKIPDLSPGKYNVKVQTLKGTSNIQELTVLATQNTNTSSYNLVNGATVTQVVGSYSPPISNFWANINGGSGVQINEFDDTQDIVSDLTVVDGVMNNYIEVTLEGIRFIGTWSPKKNVVGSACTHHLTLISTQSGRQLELEISTDPCEN